MHVRLKSRGGGERLDADDVESMVLTQAGDRRAEDPKAQEADVRRQLEHRTERSGADGLGSDANGLDNTPDRSCAPRTVRQSRTYQ